MANQIEFGLPVFPGADTSQRAPRSHAVKHVAFVEPEGVGVGLSSVARAGPVSRAVGQYQDHAVPAVPVGDESLDALYIADHVVCANRVGALVRKGESLGVVLTRPCPCEVLQLQCGVAGQILPSQQHVKVDIGLWPGFEAHLKPRIQFMCHPRERKLEVILGVKHRSFGSKRRKN